MLPACKHVLFFAVVIAVSTSTATSISASDEIFSVQRNVTLTLFDTRTDANDPKGPSRAIKSGTLVRSITPPNVATTQGNLKFVETLEENPRLGWIDSDAIIRIDRWVAFLDEKAKTMLSKKKLGKQNTSMPDLIRAQNNPQIRQAWKETAAAFEANESRKEKKRLPEPYFARAEIWMAVNNYALAIEDYVNGLRYARTSGRDIITYAPYFEKMQLATESFLNTPVPPFGATKNIALRGNYHLNLGISLYLGGKYEDAVNNLDDAISLSPSDPIAWYFRGLSYHALGNIGRAQHDALIGMHFERELTRYRQKSITRTLMRIQGENRTWLERFRLGSPNGHGLRPSDASSIATKK